MSEDLLHVAVRAELDAATGSHYAPAAFPDERFVHCCRPAQLDGVLSRYFAGRDDLVLLSLDADALDAPLVEEPGPTGEAFPHVYGPLPRAAIVEMRPLSGPPVS
jgi:uncharacterized protein (DUF952 family)